MGHGNSDQPADRMLAIISEVVRLRRPATASEIAGQLALPVPTVHRIVHQLLDRGVLKRQLGSTRVLVGPRLVAISAEVLEAAMVADEPHRILLRLAREIGENCHIGVVAEGEVLYVDSVRPSRNYGLQFEPGRRSPLHCTSIGKVWLAEMSPADFRLWLENATLAQITERTINDPGALAAVVASVRAQGWAASNGELADGVIGCAIPIRSRSGRLLAGLGISAPNVRMDMAAIEAIIPILQKAASEIASAC